MIFGFLRKNLEIKAVAVAFIMSWQVSEDGDAEASQAATPGLGTPGAHTISRTAGDLLVTFDFTNGGGRPALGLLRWVTAGSTSQCFSSNTPAMLGRPGDPQRQRLDRGGQQP